MTTIEFDMDSIDMEAHRTRPPHPRDYDTGHAMIDSLNRPIRPGDVLTWSSGGYFSRFQSVGVVVSMDSRRRFIRVRNHNDNIVTIWITYNKTILARQGDYSLIPEDYKQKLGIEDF
jgi:hypothetical protein